MGIAAEFLLDRGEGLVALDQHLVGDAELLGEADYLIVVLIALVDVDNNAVLAQQQCLAQGGHAVLGGDVVPGLEIDILDRVEGNVLDTSLARGGAVDGAVVADDEHAVLCHRYIQLDNVDAHLYRRLHSGQRVLGVVAPVAAVRGNQYRFRLRVVYLLDNTGGAVLGHRRQRYTYSH